jgi:hypothetical protein
LAVPVGLEEDEAAINIREEELKKREAKLKAREKLIGVIVFMDIDCILLSEKRGRFRG